MAPTQPDGLAVPAPVHNALTNASINSTGPTERASTVIRPPHTVETRIKRQRESLRAKTQLRQSTQAAKANQYINPARASIRAATDRILPESTTATRPGRQFTVGNVGSNGLLYLRPVTRPDHFRSPPPSPFGRTPHSLAQLGTRNEARNQRRASSIIPESSYSSVATNPKGLQKETTQEADEEESLSRKQSSEQRTPPRPDVKSRPRSYSTIHDAFHRPSTDDPGSFRVNINRKSSGSQRPITPRKHSEPTLEVPIPSFKLASPRRHKSAGARSSAQTRTTEQDHPDFDPALQFGNGLLPSVPHSTYGGSDVQHEAVPAPSLFKIRSRVQSQFSQRGHPLREPEAVYVVNVNPSIFDIFVMRPDDPAAVRYAPGTSNQIIAATPSRLVAYITSPTFLDYDLLSDFFLTFRAFMKAHELVSLLVMRLRWAVDKSDDGGRIARVRTFVALRHWILNYFLDDFVPDLALRRHFCVLVNGLHSYLKNREDGGGGDRKIVSELKKCWRRTCSLYWEDPQMTEPADVEDKILPGGFMESPGADLLVPRPTGPVEKAAIGDIELARSTSKAARKAAEAARVTNSTHRGGDHADESSRGASMNLQVEQPSRAPSAQSSQMGVLPYRLINQEDGSGIPLFPHPVQAAVLSVAPSAANSVKGGKPGPHRRQGSFSDALRNEPANKRATGKDSQGEGMKVPTMLVVPGCLIRGALYQPATPYFDTKPGVLESTMTPALIQDNGEPLPAHKKPATSAGNQGPGVRRLFGSMRKALGQKPSSEFNTSQPIPEEQPEQTQATMSPLLEDLVTSTRKPKHHHKARSQVRIDILAAMVQESFKEAVAKLEEHRRTLPPVGNPTDSGLFGGPAPGDDLLTPRLANSGFDKSLTIGSRSIVIVDDTGDDYMMSGANNPAMQSVASINMFDSNTYGSVQDLHQQQRSQIEEVENDDAPSEESSIAAHHIRKTSAQHPSVYVPTGYRKSSMAEIEQASFDDSDVLGETAPRDSADDSTLNRVDSNQEEVAVLPDPETLSLYYPNDRTSKAPTEYEPFDLSQLPPIPTSAVPTLKRKPGGDLSKVEHVKSLEVQRPETTLTEFDTAPPSRNGSKFSSLISPLSKAMAGLAGRSKQDLANSAAATPIKEEDDTLSLHRRSISLMVTHSSQPNLRPSFEAEVAKFRDLPDDEDGGVESALARLEGTYVAPERSTVVSPASAVFDPEVKDVLPGEDEEDRKERHHHEHVEDIHPVQELAPVEVQVPKKGSKSSKAGPIKTHRPVPSQSAVSEVSNSSVPLLERGLSDRGKASSVTQSIDAPATAYVPEARKIAQPIAPRGSMVSAIEPPQRTSSARPSYHEITPPKVPSKPNSLPQSFLLNESDESDDNSDTNSDDHRRSQSMRSFFDDGPSAEDNLKTPTRTGHIVDELKASAGASPHLSRGPLEANPTMFHQGLPTPRHSPTPANAADSSDVKADTAGANNATSVPRSTSVDETAANGIPRRKSSHHASAHLPFILAHTPELLAQQFTLIEKDALDEIDWRELIEMRWAQTSPPVKDWVEYLLMQQASPPAANQTPTQANHQQNPMIASGGVDLVIARFNLVVRWVQSEILLCASQQDRITTISHFIRIAAECRAIRNYATMYQMTVALLSSEIARLGKSWENVGKKEIDVLRDLEKLVQPVRNFGELRAEMEGGGVERDEGCIPFVGIYTRSLVTNAQKPATMTIEDGLPPTSTEPLVNFDRHQTAASIVKALLRLLEASSRYRFTAEPVVLSRCLWLGCLSVEELNSKSRSLEQ